MATGSILILGGARSGKSARALALALPPRTFVATSMPEPGDAELEARIAEHRAERGPDWVLVEEPLEIAEAVRRHAATHASVVVDCLTLWLSNLSVAGRNPAAETETLADAVAQSNGYVILVSNELGMGLHPETALSRAFRDAHGRMNQRIADCVDRVELVVAGQPLAIKDASKPPSAQ